MCKLRVGYPRTSRLSVGVGHTNVIRAMCVVPHNSALLAGVLMGFLYCVCIPVSPEDPVLKQGHSKDMRQSPRNGPVSVLTVHVCEAEICRRFVEDYHNTYEAFKTSE